MAQVAPKPVDDELRATVLASAFIRAGDKLNITNSALGNIIGLSGSSISRLRGGESRLLEYGTKARELATLFLRLYRSLDAIIGGDDGASARWLRNENTALEGIPYEMIQTTLGLVRVTDYLDSRRAVG